MLLHGPFTVRVKCDMDGCQESCSNVYNFKKHCQRKHADCKEVDASWKIVPAKCKQHLIIEQNKIHECNHITSIFQRFGGFILCQTETLNVHNNVCHLPTIEERIQFCSKSIQWIQLKWNRILWSKKVIWKVLWLCSYNFLGYFLWWHWKDWQWRFQPFNKDFLIIWNSFCFLDARIE